jgi:hypothetical protein
MLDTEALKQLTALRERDHAQVLQLITDTRRLCAQGSFAAAVAALRELNRSLARHTDAEERAIEALVEARRCAKAVARRFIDAHVALKVLAYETEQVLARQNPVAAANALASLRNAIEAHEAEELKEMLPLLFSSFELSGSSRDHALN